MSNRKKIVDILTKYSNNLPLSTEEQEELAKWRSFSSDNDELLQELEDKNKKYDHFDVFSAVDTVQDWETVKLRIEPTKEERNSRIPTLRKIIPYAAAAAILCAFIYIKKIKSFDTNAVQTSSIYQSKNIKPAQIGAKLILANGNQLTLDDSKITRSEDGLILSSDGNLLQIDEIPTEKKAEDSNNILVVPKGSFYNIVLSDNTKVWVNANSKLTFPNRFSSSERRVQIEGEAYFEVSHDKARPFIVESEGTEIKVLGTKFNINAYTKQIKTTLVSGKVELRAKDKKAILYPGQSADWDGQLLQVQTANISKELAWKNAEFQFENDHIIDIAQELSRWYGIEVKLSHDINTKKFYSGNISRNSNLENVIEVLNFGSDFKFELLNNKLIIKNK